MTEAAAGTAATRSATRLTGKQRKAIVAGSIGNTVEWVDWAVYSTLAPVFASQFFAKGDPAAALLSTLAVFAVGFVMRPIGGALLGAYADRRGRKKGLVLTIGLMAGAAFVIAICPTYEAIGIAAPVVLLLARLVQGFSAGGEFGSSSSFLVESAAPRRRAFAGSWQQVSVGAGALIASLMGFVLTSTLSEAAMQSWGWRLAFGIGGLLGLVGLWLRVGVEETESFRTASAQGRTARRNPLIGVFTEHPGAALRVVGITIAGTLTYYVWISYMPGYAPPPPASRCVTRCWPTPSPSPTSSAYCRLWRYCRTGSAARSRCSCSRQGSWCSPTRRSSCSHSGASGRCWSWSWSG
jgi:MHS family alpha-ketoglutarate permease-like MFS transporter